mgnify:CR=1 FL=1
MICVGQGFDAHRFCEKRDLILGGIKIDFHLGLAGHSDADVLLHAISDAILGAIGEDDLGTLFPPGEESTRDIDSQELMLYTLSLAKKNHFRIINVDSVLICEEPRIKPYRMLMKENIARLCQIEVTAVSVKGKTTEGMGFTGRKEGIAALAVVLVERMGGGR